MATQPLDQLLRQATEQTFEALAFMFPSEPMQSPPEPTMAAEVAFTGPQAGCLRLTIPRRLAAPLAGNMLGLEDEQPTPEQQADALGEMANVICGNLLPALAGDDAVFDVLAPKVLDDKAAEPPNPAARTSISFAEGWAEVALHLTEVAT
jgi:CheY-specific phosphatase CheX